MRSLSRVYRSFFLALALIGFSVPVGGPPPVELDLFIDGVYSVGGEIVVTCTATPQIESTRMKVSLEIPEGMTVTAGSTTWEGTRKKGEEVIVEVSVRIEQAGDKTMKASAVLTRPDGSRLTRRISKTIRTAR